MDHLSAFLILSQATEVLDDPQRRAEAWRQSSGIIMELAKDRRIGTLEEARQYFDTALQELGDDFPAHRSTIRLMDAETHFYERNYEDAKAALETYLEDFSDVPNRRDYAMALQFLGSTFERLGDYENARDSLAQILEMDLGPEDRWRGIPDPKAHALGWLIDFAEKHGHEEDKNDFTALLEERESE